MFAVGPVVRTTLGRTVTGGAIVEISSLSRFVTTIRYFRLTLLTDQLLENITLMSDRSY